MGERGARCQRENKMSDLTIAIIAAFIGGVAVGGAISSYIHYINGCVWRDYVRNRFEYGMKDKKEGE